MRRRPRLATILLTVNLLIFLLPLGGIAILRLYESELIRRTETELNVQGALVASIYRTELMRHLRSEESGYSLGSSLSEYGIKISSHRLPDRTSRGPRLSRHWILPKIAFTRVHQLP